MIRVNRILFFVFLFSIEFIFVLMKNNENGILINDNNNNNNGSSLLNYSIEYFVNDENSSSLLNDTLNVTSFLLKDSEKKENLGEQMNETHAKAFKSWLDSKSKQLFDLTISYSGFKQLNSTYRNHLKKDIKYEWINFTAMIMNISNRISEVLYNKTLVVQNLTELVEKTFEEYRNNESKINDSIDHPYYDAKSPLTFCDTADSYLKSLESKKSKTKGVATTPQPTTMATTSSSSGGKTRKKRDKKAPNDFDIDNPEPSATPSIKHLVSTTIVPKSPRIKTRTTTPIKTTTTETTTEVIDYSDEEYEEEEEVPHGEDPEMEFEEEDYWEIQCLNRTYDENFKAVQKINALKSTVHVPTNIYKKDIAINMTAFWTEALDEQFKKNYEGDTELFWQYFCSSQGLFRRYPGAYWNLQQQTDDFFDCRLQSWYVSAAASPKDVIFMLDTSGSMTGLRLEIGKRLIEFIMDTFTDNDFFNIFTFNDTAHYLMSDESEHEYRDRFIQAGKANKKKFIEKLKGFKSTNNMAMLNKPLQRAFEFLQNTTSGCNCNQAIMIITDGSTDNIDDIFDRYNLDRRVRVFSFKIGRDMTDSTDIKNIACDNNGEYYHVVTLTDINEHVYEYIPVLSRPMALSGVHVTTWSNVFVGHLDKELKIAVARPAFRSKSSFTPKFTKKFNYTRMLKERKNLNKTEKKMFNFGNIFNNDPSLDDLYDDDEDEDRAAFSNHNEHEQNNKKQNVLKQVLLGVVGVDVPVLRLISKVSPKYQMGVGIYIIMLDNNGFIVFHPSIKREITKGEFDIKGTSHSIDLDKFEVPIDNDDEFEDLEHEMIDQKTSNKTLKNWKREGLRVIKRSTEYVYTPVKNSPFSVAIASPSSFGRYYIDMPSSKQESIEANLKSVPKNQIKSSIQLYNCTYNFTRLADRIHSATADYCIRYLYVDTDQILAIKSDLVLHSYFYNLFDFSIFTIHKNLVKSSFYGTYSGITFYLPVTYFLPKNDNSSMDSNGECNNGDNNSVPLCSNDNELILVNLSLNLFSTESNKHTYSFEKQYYTRTIEFSDYLRTEFGLYEPIVIYFLNETSKEAKHDTLSAATSLWLDKVPAAVSGVVYDSSVLHQLLFENFSMPNCPFENCYHLCNKKRGLKVTCYLVDEHGIVVLSNSEQQVINKALHLVNPWVMKSLEIAGIYDLVIPGKELEECEEPAEIINSASLLKSFIVSLLRSLSVLFYQLIQMLFNYSTNLFGLFNGITLNELVYAAKPSASSINTTEQQIREEIIRQNKFRFRNSMCYYFGIYVFNYTKWKTLDASEYRVWCNCSTPKRYLAGYVKHSNLVMLVVEDYDKYTNCGNMSSFESSSDDETGEDTPPNTTTTTTTTTTVKTTTKRNSKKKFKSETSNSTITGGSLQEEKPKKIMRELDSKINRYRKKPEYCFNYFPNESLYVRCKTSSATNLSRSFSYFVKTYILIYLSNFMFVSYNC